MRTSESIANIAAALAKFQAEVSNPKYTANNPYYKSRYTPLQDIISHVRPQLAKHGLSVIQNPQAASPQWIEFTDIVDGVEATTTKILQNITVTTRLLHSSGEWIEGEPLTMTAEKLTPQGAGSVITYARRYALSAILGIASEDDDDGNSLEPPQGKASTQKRSPKQPPSKPDTEPQQEREGFISSKQARRLFTIAGKGNEDIVKHVIGEYGLDSTSKVPELLYKEVCDKVEVMAAERKAG